MTSAPDLRSDSRPELRPRFRLGTRLFLGISLLLILAVGASVIFTSVLARRIARQAAEDALAASSSVEDSFRTRRYEQLQLISQLFVSDPYLTAYVAEAAQTGDRRSILDLLSERQTDLDFDFAILLDPTGRVLARTDRVTAAGEDLSGRPLVAAALTRYEASGVWREGTRLYNAVAVPLVQGVDLLGFLVTGFEITDDTAAEVRQVSRTEVAFLVDSDGSPEVVASTFGPEVTERLIAALASRPGWLEPVRRGEQLEAARLEIDGEPWLVRVAPLADAAGQPVGSTLALASLDRALAPYRRIGMVLLTAGGVALLLAFGLSYVLGRRTVRPIERLVAAVEAARGGDYEQAIPRERRDEVGQLAAAFDDLLRELRERREMEQYMAELSRNLPEPSAAPATVSTRAPARADREDLTLLAIEVPGWAVRAGVEEAEAVVEGRSEELRRFVDRISGAGGAAVGSSGHRLWAAFSGEYGPWAALVTAVEIWEQQGAAAERSPAADDLTPVFAIAFGPAITGTTSFARRDHRLLLGLPVQQIESLLREATAGEILLSREVHRRLIPIFQSIGLELAPRRGVASGIELYAVTPRLASRLPRPKMTPTPVAPGPSSEAPTRTSPSMAGILRTLGPGSVLGDRFEILDSLGSGGMGVVYKARDRELDDVVALKMLRPDKAGDPELLDRLKEELKLARRITHPNVLRTYDLGTLDGVPFISMEYVRGLTLRQLLDRLGTGELLPRSAALRLMRQIALGLGAVHDCGVIHRDLKPGNVILEPTGNAKLMDFGIARTARKMPTHLTADNAIVGTPGYLAPEQLEGKEVGPRTDLYAWGVIGYELLTGHLPIEGAAPMEVLMQTLQAEPVAPREHRPDLDPRLDDLLLRCLRKKPEERPESTAAVLVALAGVERRTVR